MMPYYDVIIFTSLRGSHQVYHFLICCEFPVDLRTKGGAETTFELNLLNLILEFGGKVNSSFERGESVLCSQAFAAEVQPDGGKSMVIVWQKYGRSVAEVWFMCGKSMAKVWQKWSM